MQCHSLSIRVYYEDTDAGGIVYHASYLRFAERGRTEMLRAAGFLHAEVLAKTGLSFVVISMNIDFKSPARLDDLVVVKTRLTKVNGASLEMAQEIVRDDTVLTAMTLRLACLDCHGKAARLPSELRKLFEARG